MLDSFLLVWCVNEVADAKVIFMPCSDASFSFLILIYLFIFLKSFTSFVFGGLGGNGAGGGGGGAEIYNMYLHWNM